MTCNLKGMCHGPCPNTPDCKYGYGRHASLPARKDDSEKLRTDLLPSAPLLAIAGVLTFGAKKYADHNWRGGFKASRLIGAALRHILAYNDGEDKDPESGLSHLAHAGCCLMFLLEQEAKGTGTDDRYNQPTAQGVGE